MLVKKIFQKLRFFLDTYGKMAYAGFGR